MAKNRQDDMKFISLTINFPVLQNPTTDEAKKRPFQLAHGVKVQPCVMIDNFISREYATEHRDKYL